MSKVLSSLLFFSALSFAWATPHDSRVFSRSIMPSCEFVYQVESDVIVRLPEVTAKKMPKLPLYLRAQLKNSWEQGPQHSEVFLVPVNENYRAEFTFESMSVSKGFLFREMSFEWVYEHGVGNFVTLSHVHHVDVGRRMGEACYTSRYADEQFVEREVTLALRD